MKSLSLLGVVVLGLVVATSSYADAAKETVKGTVSVVKAEDGKVTVTVKAGEVSYSVAGEKAKALEGMNGKAVEVTGTVADVDGKKTITVEEVKEAAAQE
jgi:DNA/RNA endonuclease YhcR with UshA esterase domain